MCYLINRSKTNYPDIPLFIAKYQALFSVVEITVGHWPFSDQFQNLADQNPFWLANFTVHFQWDGNQ